MNPVSLFHPAVADWFDRSFAAPTAAQAQAWPAFQAGRHVLIAAPTGSGKTLAAFLAAIDALVAQGLAQRAHGRNPDRLRLAAQGAVERHPAQPRSAARRHPRGAAGARLARRRDPHLGAHRRHARRRARPHAPPPAAHRRDHAGVALHPARLGIGPRDARDHPHRDRRRDPRRGAEQARHPSGALARAPGRAVRRAGCSASACPPRRSRSRRSRGSWSAPARTTQSADCTHRRHRPPPRRAISRSRCRIAARSRDVGRGVGAGLRAAGPADRGASHHADLRQHPPDGRAGGAPAVRAARARTRSPRTTAASPRSSASTPSSGSSTASSRRWSRPPRSSSASTSATSTWSASSARRARSRRSCSASGAPATRSAARPRAGCSRSRATSWWNARRCSTASAAASSTGSSIPEQPLDVLAQQIVAEVAAREWSEDELFALVRRAWPYRALAREDFARSCACWRKASARAAAGAARCIHHDAVNRICCAAGAARASPR